MTRKPGKREEERGKSHHGLAGSFLLPLPVPGGRRAVWVRLASSSLVLLLLAFATSPATSQFIAPPAQPTTQAPVPDSPQTVSGTVVNGNSGEGIFRALVRLNSGSSQRAVLTDAEGHFAFLNVDPVQVNLTVRKPGYYQGQSLSDTESVALPANVLATPAQIRLYPEAILKGTVTGPDGQPLPDINLKAQRMVADDSGHRSVTVAATRTNVHGQFRLPVPAGDYRVETDFTQAPSLAGRERSAVMPVVLPESATPGESTLHLQAGEQRDLDLRPPIVPLIEVALHCNLNSRELGSLTAIAPGGAPFPVSVAASQTKPGSDPEVLAHLPAGNFVLQAHLRGFGPGSLAQANISVVAGREPVTVNVQFVPLSSIPIQVAIDQAILSALGSQDPVPSLPNPRSLNLSLEPIQADPSINEQLLRAGDSRGENFLSFTTPPGVYRLRSSLTRGWYIASASYGGADVLTNGITIAEGSSSIPLQLTLSNQAGAIHGTVTLNGAPASCWVYLLASGGPIPIFSFRSATDGTYNQTFIPPGSYRAVAFQHRHALDPSDPNALAPYSNSVGSVTVKVGDNDTLDLKAIADSELRP